MAKSAHYLYHARLSICLSILPPLSSFVHTYQYGSQWRRDFREIWYRELTTKSVEKFEIWLQSRGKKYRSLFMKT
jgi:hypothetical protein